MVGYKVPPSIGKSRLIKEAFGAKVGILEEWARNGLPETILKRAKPDGSFSAEDLPRNNAALMRWRGPDGDLPKWNDPLISRPITGKYPDMAERFRLAIEGIDEWLYRKNGRVPKLERQVAFLDAAVKRLTVQNTDLLAQIQQLREELALAKAMPAEARR